MIDIATLPEVLRLQPLADNRYQTRHEHGDNPERDVVFGGQLLAQMIMASAMASDGEKEVKSIHTIFARPGTYSEPIVYEVDSMHRGRNFASDTVTAWQGERLVSRGMLLLNSDEPDLIRHTTVTMPAVPGPEDPAGRQDRRVFPGAQGIICHGVDTRNDEPGPPELYVWTKYTQSFDSPVVNQAILSWATDGFTIGTTMRPHPGFSEGVAHRAISTGPVSHTVNFHDRFDATEWLLMAGESIWAGRGRAHGRCNIFTQDGRLVANSTQDCMVRGFPDGKDRTAADRRVM